MNHSGIEWTDRTWNPVSGCTKVSQGCKHCYAERLWPKVEAAERKREHLAWQTVAPRPFTTIRLHPDRLDQPLRIRKPQRIFVNSMSDLFHEDVPDDFLDQIFTFMSRCPQHTFQVLTKRPARMLNYLGCQPLPRRRWEAIGRNLGWSLFAPPPLLANVWLGVSVEDQDAANERIPLLLQTPAAVRFISAEPLLGPLTIFDLDGPIDVPDGDKSPLHWVIAGGESGPNARPSHPDWFRWLRDQCDDNDVPFFFKQWGEWAPETVATSERAAREAIYLQPDGSLRSAAFGARNGATTMQRNGKRNTGRQLDGRTHNAFPTTQEITWQR